MRFRASCLPAWSLAGLLLSIPAYASDAAHDWLAKMTRAMHTLDYEGVFVYQHESRIETMHIVHKVVDGVARERLVSLNGVPREIVRDTQEVRFYFPNDNAVIVEPRRTSGKNFPSILPEQFQGLDENYTVSVGKQERVAGRSAQQVFIRPRDNFRYGYQLWADKETGLLLRADLMDETDHALEQFVFTHITVNASIPASALTPELARQGMTWHRDRSAADAATTVGWSATQLPKGFKLSTQLKREIAARKKLVQHLVYSDGLAAVSVFIEKQDADNKHASPGTNRFGAVNTFATVVDGYHIVAMGEVPAATVSYIGKSVAHQP